ncbi:MAG TPA: UPF0758 domain-containing protein [Candidatus Limnocylindrales bacterium]
MSIVGVDRRGLSVVQPGRAIRELPPSERPRERLQLRGPAGLTAAELVGLLWGSGARGRSAVDLAADALGRFDGLTGLSRASGPELEAVPGVGAVRAAQLQAAFELGRRLLADWPAGRWSIRSPRDLADRLVLQMGRLEREELRVVILNTKNVVLRVVTIYREKGSCSTIIRRCGTSPIADSRPAPSNATRWTSNRTRSTAGRRSTITRSLAGGRTGE